MQPGLILSGKYRLDSLLDRGAMGSVWRATHLGLEAPVAVKCMDPATWEVPGSLQRFHREARAAAALRSAHVVQILDYGVDEALNHPFIVMELLDGESLGKRLRREGRIRAPELVRVIADVCRALTRAHDAGIVHRDLKPENIFIVRENDREMTKVLDFGIAKAAVVGTLESSTQAGAIFGTPYYMSPEQICDSKSIDHRSDLWSLGVIACECLTGKRPFVAENLAALAMAIATRPIPRASELGPVPPDFDRWLARALVRDPNERFQSARELAEALEAACGISAEALSSMTLAPSSLIESRPRFPLVANEALGRKDAAREDSRAPNATDPQEVAPSEAPEDPEAPEEQLMSRTPPAAIATVPRTPEKRRRWSLALTAVAVTFVAVAGLALRRPRSAIDDSQPPSAAVPFESHVLAAHTPSSVASAPAQAAPLQADLPLGSVAPAALKPSANALPSAEAEPATPNVLPIGRIPLGNTRSETSHTGSATKAKAPPRARVPAKAPTAAPATSSITLESVIDERK